MSKIAFASITLAFSLAFANTSHAATNLILNYDFSANAADYTASPGYNGSPGNPGTPTDWVAGAGGVGSSGSPFAPTNLYIDGNSSDTVTDFAFLQKNYASVSQSFDVVAGQEYELTYVAAARQNESNDEINATVSYNSDPTDLLVSTTNAVSNSDFTTFTEDFDAASSGEVTLEFTPSKVGVSPTDYSTDFTSDVTNVSVVDISPSIPEPATWAMLGAGVAILFGFLRLRRKA